MEMNATQGTTGMERKATGGAFGILAGSIAKDEAGVRSRLGKLFSGAGSNNGNEKATLQWFLGAKEASSAGFNTQDLRVERS